MKKFALFSVNRTEGVIQFAKVLLSKGWEVIATEKPFNLLRSEGLRVISVGEFVGCDEVYPFPPTLHPKIELALTTKVEESIELLYDLPYSLDSGNDVGGHTLLALAAKGERLVAGNYEDMQWLIDSIGRGVVEETLRQELICKANRMVIAHYRQVLSKNSPDSTIILQASACKKLEEGENPYQRPASLFEDGDVDPLSLCRFEQVAGPLPCYTNMADLDQVVQSLCKLHLAFLKSRGKAPYLTVAAKHGNPCGIGISWGDRGESIEKALWGNPLAIWGGEVVVNFTLDEREAGILFQSEERGRRFSSNKWMLDVIAAPGLLSRGQEILMERKRSKLFVNPALENPGLSSQRMVLRPVRGGYLAQPPNDYVLDLGEIRWVDSPPAQSLLESLVVAWGAAYTSMYGGNEVAIAHEGALTAVGGGSSTVEAVETALFKRRKNEVQSPFVFVADAFFPFIDAPEILLEAGAIAGLVPGGGVRQEEVYNYFRKRNVPLGIIPEQYRGFCRH